jgi:glycosyltransferase involved in cell wall biosynthesis
MHLGTPQIVTDAQAVRDYALPGRTGVLVPFGDADAIAAALVRALEGDPVIRAMAQDAQAYARRFLSHSYALRRVSQILHASIEGREIARVDADWERFVRTENE